MKTPRSLLYSALFLALKPHDMLAENPAGLLHYIIAKRDLHILARRTKLSHDRGPYSLYQERLTAKWQQIIHF
jgi:hypothetical protein